MRKGEKEVDGRGLHSSIDLGGAVATMVNDTLLLAAVGNRGRKRRRRYRERRLEAYLRTKM